MRDRAFSIVELIIALALLALVALVALPAGVSLLTREGARSGVFACEAALRSARQDAMRDGLVLEVGARERDGAWEMVVREMSSAPGDDDRVRADENEAAADPFAEAAQSDDDNWRVIATLPKDFAFSFEAPADVLDALEVPGPIDFTEALTAQEEPPTRIALLLPNGAVDAVETWRLVAGPGGVDERRLLLSVGYWSGAIEATPETRDPLASPGTFVTEPQGPAGAP